MTISRLTTGITIPAPLLARMDAAAARDETRQEGVAIAHEILLATRPLVQGVYIMPPFRRYDLAAEVIAVLREEPHARMGFHGFSTV